MTIELEHSAFDAGVADVRAAAADIGEHRRALDREVRGLLDGAWTGAAAAGFGDAWEQWQAGAAEVVTALGAMAELLDLVHGDLADQDVASVVSLTGVGHRMALRLGGDL